MLEEAAPGCLPATALPLLLPMVAPSDLICTSRLVMISPPAAEAFGSDAASPWTAFASRVAGAAAAVLLDRPSVPGECVGLITLMRGLLGVVRLVDALGTKLLVEAVFICILFSCCSSSWLFCSDEEARPFSLLRRLPSTAPFRGVTGAPCPAG